MIIIKKKSTSSKFLKVSCSECGNKQVIFNRPTTKIDCDNCSSVICKPTGGMGSVQSKIEEVFR